MKKLVYLLFTLALLTAHAQENKVAASTLQLFTESMKKGDTKSARSFLIDENISAENLQKLNTIIVKVNQYLSTGKVKALREGSRLYSIPLRGSVIYLLNENGRWYFTEGTTQNIPNLLKIAETLSTPEKTMDFFIKSVNKNNIAAANLCFVEQGKAPIEAKNAKNFLKTLNLIIEKKVQGQYQGKTEKTLVGYQLKDNDGNIELDVYLTKELDGDWLFTNNTRTRIESLHRQTTAKKINKFVSPSFHKTIFLIKNWQWAGIIFILLLGVIVQWVLQVIFKKTIIKRMNLDPDKKKFRSITILSISVSWYLLFPYLGIEQEAVVILTNAAGIIAMFSTLFVISRAMDFFKDMLLAKANKTENKVDDVLIPMFHKLAKLTLYIVGMILIASNIGLNVTSLLAGVGLAGMAFALAAKDTVENIFGSVTVLLDKPFEVGDWVVIDGVEGTVEQIGLRSTRIRTFYCSQVNVPNSTLISATVDNYGRRSYRRIRTLLSLTYDTPPDKIEAFCEGVRELIRQHPHTRKDYYHVYLNQFNGSSLDVLLYCFLDVDDWAIELREKQRLFLDIIRLAGRLDVDFAYPTQTLHMANNDALSPAEKNTDLDSINQALLSGRHLSQTIVKESVPESNNIPQSIDYLKGNPYHVEK